MNESLPHRSLASFAGALCGVWAFCIMALAMAMTVYGGLGGGIGSVLFVIGVLALVVAYVYATFALMAGRPRGAWVAAILGTITILAEVRAPLFSRSPATPVNLMIVALALGSLGVLHTCWNPPDRAAASASRTTLLAGLVLLASPILAWAQGATGAGQGGLWALCLLGISWLLARRNGFGTVLAAAAAAFALFLAWNAVRVPAELRSLIPNYAVLITSRILAAGLLVSAAARAFRGSAPAPVM